MVTTGELLSILFFGAWIYSIIDAATTDAAAVRNLPKWAWIVIVALLFPLGGIAWFVFGRPPRSTPRAPRASVPRPTFNPPRQRTPRRRPEKVEDEADVLARIAERDRLLAQWADEDRRKAEGSQPADPGA